MKPNLDTYPKEQFCREQVLLQIYELRQGLTLRHLTFLIVREGMENMLALVEVMKSEDEISAAVRINSRVFSYFPRC